jgi:hypothetical protein
MRLIFTSGVRPIDSGLSLKVGIVGGSFWQIESGD